MAADIRLLAADACPGDSAYQRPTTATAAVLEIPAAMRGKFVRFSAETSDVYIRFGTSVSVNVDNTADSTVASNALTEDTTTPHLHVVAGQSEQLRLQAAWTHFAHISADANGKLRFALWTGSNGAD